MSSPKQSIIFSKVIPALQADRARRRGPLNIVPFGKPGGAICGLISLGQPAFLDPHPHTFQQRYNSTDGATRCRRSRLPTA